MTHNDTDSESVLLAVNGTLMCSLELNHHMIEVGAKLVRETHTAPRYRLWSIHDRHPAMLRVSGAGRSIALEIWSLSAAGLLHVLLKEPAGLTIGKVQLEDGSEVLGVLGEAVLCEGQREITDWGGWRAYRAAQ